MSLGPRALHRLARALLLPAVLLVTALWSPAARAQDPIVRAVLFFSPTCGHCAYVIDEWVFPVWFPRYGGEPEIRWDESLGDEAAFYLGSNGTLEILFVDIEGPAGAEFFIASNEPLGLAPEQRAVPRLVVGDRCLIGSRDIPEQFPGIVEAGLASSGIDWPDLPGLAGILAGIPGPAPTTTSAPAGSTGTGPDASTTAGGANSTTGAPPTTSTTAGGGALPTGADGPWDRFRRDQPANSLALGVLALMVASLAGALSAVRRGRGGSGPGFAVPLLAAIGLGVAVYLAVVEMGGSDAVCGPVGQCNEVQDSAWARLFGIVPVGLVGVAGYAVVLASWALARFGPARTADWSRVALFAGTAAGVGLSLYLTFLEPFVIGATCLWCLGSAVIVTLLMWLAAKPAGAAWRRLREASAGSAGDDEPRGPRPGAESVEPG